MTDHRPWHGVLVATALPLNDDLSVNHDRYAEHCAWLKAMVDSGEIFHPLRWTAAEAQIGRPLTSLAIPLFRAKDPRVNDERADGLIELVLPADTRLVRVARLVASGVATAAGFDVEEVEDHPVQRACRVPRA